MYFGFRFSWRLSLVEENAKLADCHSRCGLTWFANWLSLLDGEQVSILCISPPSWSTSIIQGTYLGINTVVKFIFPSIFVWTYMISTCSFWIPNAWMVSGHPDVWYMLEQWNDVICYVQLKSRHNFTGIPPPLHYLLGFNFYSQGWNRNKLIFILVLVTVGGPKSLLITLGRDVAHNFHNFCEPHFLPMKLGMVGFLQPIKSSGWSWSCTCFKAVWSSPDLVSCVYFSWRHFLLWLPCYNGSVQVSFWSQDLACRYHPTISLTRLKGLCWGQTGPGLLPGQDILLGCLLASSCSPPAEAASWEIE